MNLNRRIQSFQSSLSEFVLLISFCFLLVTAISINKYNELFEAAKDPAALSEELSNLRQKVRNLEEKISFQEDYSEVVYLEKLESLVENKIDIEDDWQKIEQATNLIKNSNLSSNNILELRDLLEDGNISDILDMANKNSDLKNELEKVTAQTEFLRKRSGLDHPTCLVSSKGSIRYLMTVVLENNAFGIYNKTKEASNFFPEHNKLKPSDFVRSADLALEDSKNQSLECRYYVKVVDKTTDKGLYKLRLSQVENSFYKYLRN
ncbi:hypothetical protein AB4524_00690 [Vibrio breoganii]